MFTEKCIIVVRWTGFGVTQPGLKMSGLLPISCEALGRLLLCVYLLITVYGSNGGTYFMGFI